MTGSVLVRPELSGPAVTLGRMRPALKPGLLPVWRDRDTLQIGIDPRRAVALTGMADAAWVISLLDGSRDRAQVIAAARDRGMPAELADRVLTLLAAGGALDDFPAGTYRVLSRQLRARLAPELAATSLAHGYGDGGARALARRRAAHVRVLGGGRLEPAITAILAASGIGQVDGGDARHGEPAPTEPAPARQRGTGSAGTGSTGTGRAGAGWTGTGRAGTSGAGAGNAAGPGRAGRSHRPGTSRPADAGADTAPGRLGERGDRRGRPAGASRPVSLLALPGSGQDRSRPGLAADPGPAGRPAARSARLRRRPGRGRGRSGRRPGAGLY